MSVVCASLCVGNFDVSETKRFRGGSYPRGTYRKVSMARQLVTSSMTSRD